MSDLYRKLCCGMYRLVTKRTEKYESKKCEREFVRQTIRRARHVLLFTDFVNFSWSRSSR